MSEPRRRYYFEHPIQGPKGKDRWNHSRRITITATASEADEFRHHLVKIRNDLRFGLRTVEEVRAMFRTKEVSEKPIPVSRLVGLYIEPPGRLGPATVTQIVSWLSTYGRPLASRDARTLDAHTMAQWIQSLHAQGYAPASVQMGWRVISMVVRHALELGELSECPWSTWRPHIRASREPKILECARDVRELAQLLEAARRMDAARRVTKDRRLVVWSLEVRILVGVAMGLGQGELAGLRWHDLHPSRGEVAIVRQYAGEPLKTSSRAASLRVSPELFERLEVHRRDVERLGLYRPDGPIFPNALKSAPGKPPAPYARRPDGNSDRSTEVIRVTEIRACAELAGLPNAKAWSTRSLRHTYATLEAKARRGDWVALAERMRHGSTASSAHYLHRQSREPTEPGFELIAPVLPELPPHSNGGGA